MSPKLIKRLGYIAIIPYAFHILPYAQCKSSHDMERGENPSFILIIRTFCVFAGDIPF